MSQTHLLLLLVALFRGMEAMTTPSPSLASSPSPSPSVSPTTTVFVITNQENSLRLVSNSATCDKGRVEAHDKDLGWGTVAECWAQFPSVEDGFAICKSLGFSDVSGYHTGESSYQMATADTSIAAEPYYCTLGFVSCWSGDTKVCGNSTHIGDCSIATGKEDCQSNFDDTTYNCHSYDYYVHCNGTSTHNCTAHSSDELPINGDDCKPAWVRHSAAIVVIVIVVGVCCCCIFVCAPFLIIFVCGVTICGCGVNAAARARERRNPSHDNQQSAPVVVQSAPAPSRYINGQQIEPIQEESPGFASQPVPMQQQQCIPSMEQEGVQSPIIGNTHDVIPQEPK